MNDNYENESDENLVPVVASLLSAIGSDTSISCIDALSPRSEPVESTPIKFGESLQKDNENFEESIFLAGNIILSPAGSEPVDATPIPAEETPLVYTVQ